MDVASVVVVADVTADDFADVVDVVVTAIVVAIVAVLATVVVADAEVAATAFVATVAYVATDVVVVVATDANAYTYCCCLHIPPHSNMSTLCMRAFGHGGGVFIY